MHYRVRSKHDLNQLILIKDENNTYRMIEGAFMSNRTKLMAFNKLLITHELSLQTSENNSLPYPHDGDSNKKSPTDGSSKNNELP